MESFKRFFGLIKTPTQLVDRMLFEFRVMDGEETTNKPRKVYHNIACSYIDLKTFFANARLFTRHCRF